MLNNCRQRTQEKRPLQHHLYFRRTLENKVAFIRMWFFKRSEILLIQEKLLFSKTWHLTHVQLYENISHQKYLLHNLTL